MWFWASPISDFCLWSPTNNNRSLVRQNYITKLVISAPQYTLWKSCPTSSHLNLCYYTYWLQQVMLNCQFKWLNIISWELEFGRLVYDPRFQDLKSHQFFYSYPWQRKHVICEIWQEIRLQSIYSTIENTSNVHWCSEQIAKQRMI